METVGYFAYSSEEEMQRKLERLEQYDLDKIYGIEKVKGRKNLFADFLEDTIPDHRHTIIIYGLDVLGSSKEDIYNSICVLKDMGYESQLVCDSCENTTDKFFPDFLVDLPGQE